MQAGWEKDDDQWRGGSSEGNDHGLLPRPGSGGCIPPVSVFSASVCLLVLFIFFIFIRQKKMLNRPATNFVDKKSLHFSADTLKGNK